MTQVVAAIAAAAVLFVVANGKSGFDAVTSGFATNGYGDRSPEGYSLLAVLVIEVVLTAVFLYVILGATDTRAPKGFAPIAIGLSLTLIHLASIPVSNTSVNPARSTGPALFAGSDALVQLWVFWVAPLVGARSPGRRTRSCSAGTRPSRRCRRRPRPELEVLATGCGWWWARCGVRRGCRIPTVSRFLDDAGSGYLPI